MGLKKMAWICLKCGLGAKKVVLDKYEYIEGTELHNVWACQCPECEELFFDEKQVELMDSKSGV